MSTSWNSTFSLAKQTLKTFCCSSPDAIFAYDKYSWEVQYLHHLKLWQLENLQHCSLKPKAWKCQSPVKLSHNRPFVGIMRVIMIMWIAVKNWPNLKKCKREIYFEYFSHREWPEPKPWCERGPWWVCWWHILWLIQNMLEKWKGKTPRIGVKQLDWMKSRLVPKVTKGRRFWPSTHTLREIRRFQKSTELLIPKLPFLRVVHEILQRDHGCHHIQAGTVLALHEVTEAYLVR